MSSMWGNEEKLLIWILFYVLLLIYIDISDTLKAVYGL